MHLANSSSFTTDCVGMTGTSVKILEIPPQTYSGFSFLFILNKENNIQITSIEKEQYTNYIYRKWASGCFKLFPSMSEVINERQKATGFIMWQWGLFCYFSWDVKHTRHALVSALTSAFNYIKIIFLMCIHSENTLKPCTLILIQRNYVKWRNCTFYMSHIKVKLTLCMDCQLFMLPLIKQNYGKAHV